MGCIFFWILLSWCCNPALAFEKLMNTATNNEHHGIRTLSLSFNIHQLQLLKKSLHSERLKNKPVVLKQLFQWRLRKRKNHPKFHHFSIFGCWLKGKTCSTNLETPSFTSFHLRHESVMKPIMRWRHLHPRFLGDFVFKCNQPCLLKSCALWSHGAVGCDGQEDHPTSTYQVDMLHIGV